MSDNIESWKWIHQQLTDQIDREFDLLGQRMNWLLNSNAFLFTVNAISIGGLDGKYANISFILMLGAALLGTLICILSYMVMRAARVAVEERKTDRFAYEEKIRQEFEFDFDVTVPATTSSHCIGNSPYILLPIAIFLIWGALIFNIVRIAGFMS